MPVDPQRLAQDAAVQKALDNDDCPECHGQWVAVYGDTARGRGVGGQAMTSAKCGRCFPRLFAAVCAAHLDALAAGEGLDFEAAQRLATGHATPDADDAWGAAYESELDRQHHAIVGALRAKLEYYQGREAHFAKVLGVADGGQYRADWDGPLTAVLDKLAAAEARVEELEGTQAYIRKNALEIANSYVDAPQSKARICAVAILGLTSEAP